jgi:nucleotide-binding universal stress UspA family protein
MAAFKSILVDIDATASAHPALDRAVELARICGAALRIVDVMSVPAEAGRLLPSGAAERLAATRRERLAAVAGTFSGLTVSYELLTGRPSRSLIQEVVRTGHDLLIRSHARDLAAVKPFGPIDMQLFRYCPCAVWAVGPGATTAPRHVLGAVHANPDDPQEQAVNAKIVDAALLMASIDRGSITILQAWSAWGEDLLRSHSTPQEVAAYARAAERTAQADLDRLVASFAPRLAPARVELVRGLPEEVIPSYAVSRGVDLVVLGTVARTGIAGFFIGNTAERLLQRLGCSVLAVKPDGFVTPVRLDR